MRNKSLLMQRVPSEGVAFLGPLASVCLFAALELSDEDSVKAEAVAMKRRQLEESYDRSLTNFCCGDLFSSLWKTLPMLLLLLLLCSSSMLLFPLLLLGLPSPASLAPDSVVAEHWGELLLAAWLLADATGRHLVGLLRGCCCGCWLLAVCVLARTFAVAVLVGCVCLGGPDSDLWASVPLLPLASPYVRSVYVAPVVAALGLSHGLLGSSAVLLCADAVEPYEKRVAGVLSGLAVSLGLLLGAVGCWLQTAS
jgi:Nucleoside transporter